MTFPTPLLDARLARQKAANEQARQQILQMTQHWLSSNAARYGIESGYIFGSVTVPGRFSDRSDVDLAVETHKTGDICALMGDLSMYINRDVDLIPLDQCHFAEKIRRIGLSWTQNASPG
ncbi:MAG: nucleotidyltransferase domain-containing protein [Phormidesmis sp.]